jgi:hypothetical protein
MIIWGSRGREKEMSSGQFYCPKCATLRPYKFKRVGKYFTLYFIPLFETKKLGEYVECQHCHQTFNPEVLNLNPTPQAEQPLPVLKAELTTNEMAKSMSQNSITCSKCNRVNSAQNIVCSKCGVVLQTTMQSEATMPVVTNPSFAEVMRLGDLFIESLKPSIPRLKEIVGLASEMVVEVVAPIFDKYFEHHIFTESIINEEIERVVAHAQMWAIACFGIGVEQGIGNLAFEAAVKDVMLVSRAFGIHLAYFLGALVKKGVINQQEAVSHGEFITGKVQAWGIKIEELGRNDYKSVTRLNSNFLTAVNELHKIADS